MLNRRTMLSQSAKVAALLAGAGLLLLAALLAHVTAADAASASGSAVATEARG